MYFANIKNLCEMEYNEQWEQIRIMLFNKWQEDKDNFEILIRLASECWYVMVNWDCCLNNQNLVYGRFKNDLINTYTFGLKYFSGDMKFLCMFGYMISQFPYFFYDSKEPDDQYTVWENKGKKMLEIAHQNNPNDPITKVLFLGTTNRVKEYKTTKSNLYTFLSEIFPGDTSIEQYFKDILGN